MGKRPTGEESLRVIPIFSFGWRVAVFFATVESSVFSPVPRGVSWVLISIDSLSIRFGSFGERDVALAGILAVGESLRGIWVSTFDWEMAAEFFAALGDQGCCTSPWGFL